MGEGSGLTGDFGQVLSRNVGWFDFNDEHQRLQERHRRASISLSHASGTVQDWSPIQVLSTLWDYQRRLARWVVTYTVSVT